MFSNLSSSHSSHGDVGQCSQERERKEVRKVENSYGNLEMSSRRDGGFAEGKSRHPGRCVVSCTIIDVKTRIKESVRHGFDKNANRRARIGGEITSPRLDSGSSIKVVSYILSLLNTLLLKDSSYSLHGTTVKPRDGPLGEVLPDPPPSAFGLKRHDISP
jgi:hypothetical protein